MKWTGFFELLLFLKAFRLTGDIFLKFTSVFASFD